MSLSRDISGDRRIRTVWINAQRKNTYVIHKRDCPAAVRFAQRDYDGQRWFIAPADVIRDYEPSQYPIISKGPPCCGGLAFPSGSQYIDLAETQFCRCGHPLGAHRSERYYPYSWVCLTCNCKAYKETELNA